ncbi:hypothetical protein D046_0310B, partial [Vibrio parahaemolyticus V-223/04]
FDLNFGGLGD